MRPVQGAYPPSHLGLERTGRLMCEDEAGLGATLTWGGDGRRGGRSVWVWSVEKHGLSACDVTPLTVRGLVKNNLFLPPPPRTVWRQRQSRREADAAPSLTIRERERRNLSLIHPQSTTALSL